MVEVLAVIRAVERKFGQLFEYQVIRDYEMSDKYFGLVFASFQDSASLSRVPYDGIEMAVSVPFATVEDQPGGVGWDDIAPFLEAKGHDPTFTGRLPTKKEARLKKGDRMVYFRVGHAKKQLETAPSATLRLDTQTQRQNAIDFLEWGRTLPLKPIRADRPIAEEDLFEDSTLDNVRLRAALRYASQALGVRNPHEIYPEDEANVNEAHTEIPGGSSQRPGHPTATLNASHHPTFRKSLDEPQGGEETCKGKGEHSGNTTIQLLRERLDAASRLRKHLERR
ncbi:hypothetical protein FA15DRAFT_594770 [Coprinopsis marcescibilis]|uniref:Uncharacterized protein n=1 Tax=Coprinopsis marcescibilis TaxID=230819 RepID=A0A5C3KRN9_COPMA|nr:hypothetical protein FA15DRAFT_594770 [Coprinopsis marcescibilis]